MPLEQSHPRTNTLLAALPTDEYSRIEPHLRSVELTLGEVIFRPDDVLYQVYFPTTAVVSLLNDLVDGSGIEVGLVGFEGLAGVSAAISAPENKLATIQHTGTAFRLDAEIFREVFYKCGVLHEMVIRYMYALSSQVSQSVVCNVRHSIEQRLVRWLLMNHDRVQNREFTLTQEFVASLLGVRRAGVSESAKNLQQRGLIDYRRGHIYIVDRAGLEAVGCECYGVVKQDFDRILSGKIQLRR
jgi:CRP-like cAMP-binding protein